MLLPALNKARDKARSIKCVSNLGQVAKYQRLYASDYDDYFTGRDKLLSGTSVSQWPVMLVKLKYITEVVNNDYQVLYCPGAQGLKNCSTALPPPAEYWQQMTYGLMDAPRFHGDTLPWHSYKVDKYCEGIGPKGSETAGTTNKSPSAVPLLGDSRSALTYTGAARQSYTMGCLVSAASPMHLRHDRKGNVVFVDGHVGNWTMEEARDNTWHPLFTAY